MFVVASWIGIGLLLLQVGLTANFKLQVSDNCAQDLLRISEQEDVFLSVELVNNVNGYHKN